MLKIIKLMILFILLVFSLLGFVLFLGIKVDSFSFGNFSISQLYLKLDKKLILEAKEIVFTLKESDVESSTEDLQKSLSNFQLLLKVFQKINIERLKIKDNEFIILLDEHHLYLDNKYINLSSELDFIGTQVVFDIYSIYLKDIGLLLDGRSKIDLSKKMLNFFGTYAYAYVEGDINVQVTPEMLDFYVNTAKKIPSLKFLKELFRLDSIAEAWMYDNVEGDIQLNYLYGKIDLQKKHVLMDSLAGEAVIDNAKISFHKDVKPVDTKKLTIYYKNDTLSFDLEKPHYNQSDIDGSRVYITDLTSQQKGVVVVDLKTQSMLNEDILEILKAYKIALPLQQKNGKLNSSLILKIPYLASKKMEIDGHFKLSDAVLRLKNFEFLAKKADVVLKNSNVIIRDAHVVHKEMLDAFLELDIDTITQTAKGNTQINNFVLKEDKEDIVRLSNTNTALAIDFKNSTKINLQAFETALDIQKEVVRIDIKKLEKIYEQSPLLKKTGIHYGNLSVDFYDENRIEFSIDAQQLDVPFEKNGKKITELQAKGKIEKGVVTVVTNNDDIAIVLKKEALPSLKLRNIDLVLNNDKDTEKKSLPNIELLLHNATIKLDETHKYMAEWADITIKDNGISFEGKALDLDLPISKGGRKVDTLELRGTYKDKILHIQSKDKNLELKYILPTEKLSMKLNGYDVMYDTSMESNSESKIAYYIDGINSNIIMNEKFIAKATSYKFIFENYKTDIHLKYNNTLFEYHKDYEGNIFVEAKDMDDVFLNALLSKNLIKGGNVYLKANGKEGKISGSATLDNTKIVDLAILNNLLIFINTSPALINPFLAIPSVVGMATNEGFTLNGYQVTKGTVDFVYDFNQKFLNMHKIQTQGNGIDFDGFTTINFNNSHIDGKLKMVFFKDYSKIVGAIPVLNYILLGDEKRVDTEVILQGTLDKPEYKTKLAKEGVSAPVNVIKRIIQSPVKIIESLTGGKEEVESKKEE